MPDSVQPLERGLLVFTPREGEEGLDIRQKELRALAETARVEVVEEVVQRLRGCMRILGRGKSEEIATMVDAQDIDVVIFDAFLSPSETRLFEEALGTKVVDRAALILDIFAARATSKEGQLQVEMAQLSYLLPRLTGRGTALSRLGGGVGTRGPGETQLETDRRHIRRRLHHVKQELEDVVRARAVQRAARSRLSLPYLVLVGYTNAGKSSLLNALAGDDIYVADQLFATLDPTTRRIQAPDGTEYFISDTVGFIRDLPPQLTIAFKATLEIVKEADLLLHVVDISEPGYEERVEIVDRFLEELGAAGTPRRLICNKIDRLEEVPALPPALAKDDPIFLSTQTPAAVAPLWEALAAFRQTARREVSLQLANNAEGARLLAMAHRIGQVEDLVYEADGLHFTLIYHEHLPQDLAIAAGLRDGKDNDDTPFS